jgi:hypothetical protein
MKEETRKKREAEREGGRQMTRTNFDVWRDQLTPDDIVVTDFSFSMGCSAFYGHYDGCDACPAKSHCLGKDISCKEGWLSWANAPAKEEAK